ncbi:MAG: hypothetical protein LQ338_006892 [Usnochroma carphineum]|nr:MAG: hypothetical protein LQ338_006892 [Usnochroma carphineum]
MSKHHPPLPAIAIYRIEFDPSAIFLARPTSTVIHSLPGAIGYPSTQSTLNLVHKQQETRKIKRTL